MQRFFFAHSRESWVALPMFRLVIDYEEEDRRCPKAIPSDPLTLSQMSFDTRRYRNAAFVFYII